MKTVQVHLIIWTTSVEYFGSNFILCAQNNVTNGNLITRDIFFCVYSWRSEKQEILLGYNNLHISVIIIILYE